MNSLWGSATVITVMPAITVGMVVTAVLRVTRLMVGMSPSGVPSGPQHLNEFLKHTAKI